MKPLQFSMPGGPEHMIPTGPLGLPDLEPVDIDSLTLSLEKVDRALRQHLYRYSGKGGQDRKQFRIDALYQQIETRGTVEMPIIYHLHLSHEDLSVVRGRHAIAAMCELGYKEARFVVPAVQKQAFIDHYRLD